MPVTLIALSAALAVLTAAAPVSAHHAFAAEFDANQPVTLRGVVTKVERVNPHGWIYLDVKDSTGKIVNWAIETAASSQLAKRGIGKNFPPIGMEIIVTGFRARDGSTTANGATLKNSEGKDLFSVASGDADAPRR